MNTKSQISNYKRIAWLILVLIVGLCAVSIPKIKSITFDYNIERFFGPSDPDLIYYHNHRELFENDNDFVLVGIHNKKGIFDSVFLNKVDNLTELIKKLSLVNEVISPTQIKKKAKVPVIGFVTTPLLHINERSKYTTDQEKIYSTNDYYRTFFSKDTSALLLYIKKEENTTKSANDSLLSSIEKILLLQDFDEYHLAGRIKTQNFYVKSMNSEITFLMSITIILLILFLFFTFRNLWAVITPIVILLISLIFIFAIIKIFIGELDLLMTLLPTLLFIIGISNCVHILTGYNEEFLIHQDKLSALKNTVIKIGKATFLTSFTTAIGFISLWFIDIPPIQNFGTITAVGVMITWLVSILLLPAVIFITPTKHYAKNERKNSTWNGILSPLYSIILSQRKITLILTIAFLIISIFGFFKLRTNNFFLDDLGPKTSLIKDMKFFEKEFSGIRPFEIGFSVKDSSSSIFDLNVLNEIDSVENYLRETYGVNMILSPLTIIKEANRSINAGNSDYYSIPKSKKELKKIKKHFDKNSKNEHISTLITSDAKRGRISGKIHDLGSSKVNQLNNSLDEFLLKNTKYVEYEITGAANLMDQTSALVSKKIMKGLLFSFMVVSLIMGLLFRSIKLAFISLIPNLLPLVFVAGIMGLIGVDLKVSTVVVFTIGFGIAVDDTIHLLVRYKFELGKNSNKKEAFRQAILTTGKAVIITSFILSAGFLTFLFSDFKSTFYIGILTTLILLFALIADLFLLPILIIRPDKKEK